MHSSEKVFFRQQMFKTKTNHCIPLDSKTTRVRPLHTFFKVYVAPLPLEFWLEKSGSKNIFKKKKTLKFKRNNKCNQKKII